MAKRSKKRKFVPKPIKVEENEEPVNDMEKSGLSEPFQDKIFMPAKFTEIREEIASLQNESADIPDKILPCDEVRNSTSYSMYECSYCKVLLPAQGNLRNHVEMTHCDEQDFDEVHEKVCNDVISFRIEVETKVVAGENEKVDKPKRKRKFKDAGLVCDYPGCGKKFERRGALKTHGIVHKISKTCQHCSSPFKTVSALIRHIERRHNARKTHKVICMYGKCKKVFNNPIELRDHQLAHREKHRCQLCGSCFSGSGSLKRHIRIMHVPGAEDLVQCDNCEQTIVRHSLENHKLYSCNGKEGMICRYENCRRKFYSKAACCLHERSHRKNTPEDSLIRQMLDDGLNEDFKANEENPQEQIQEGENELELEDDKSAIRAMLGSGSVIAENVPTDELDLEIEEEGYSVDVEDEGDFQCPHEGCILTFSTQEKLDWHLKYTLHESTTPSDNPFYCPYKDCGAQYESKPKLLEHMRNEHWGTRKSKLRAAAIKAKAARNSAATSKPNIIANQRKCPVCFENFTCASKMKKHLRGSHDASSIPTQSTEEETEIGVSSKDAENCSEKSKGESDKNLVFDLQMYICPMCQASYHNANALKYHLHRHHEGSDMALLYANEVNQNSESFLDVVPSTLYGDSFKSRERTYKKKGSPTEESPVKWKKNSTALCSEIPDVKSDNNENNNCDIENEDKNVDSPKKIEKIQLSGDAGTRENETNENDKSTEETTKSDDTSDGTDKKKPKLMCRYPGCFESYKNRFELMCHQRSHEKLLKCPNEGCNQEFFSSSNLRLHIQMVHAENDTKCKDCGIVGKRSYIIYRHAKFCPKNMNLKCGQCGKSFMKVSSYKNHTKSHEHVKVKKYKCKYDDCEKKFKTQQDLSRHHNVHTGARPHKCPYADCDKTYKQRPHLLVHIKTSHSLLSEEPSKKFTCEHCGSEFKHACGRGKHIRKSCLRGPNRDVILANRKRKPPVNDSFEGTEIDDEDD